MIQIWIFKGISTMIDVILLEVQFDFNLIQNGSAREVLH